MLPQTYFISLNDVQHLTTPNQNTQQINFWGKKQTKKIQSYDVLKFRQFVYLLLQVLQHFLPQARGRCFTEVDDARLIFPNVVHEHHSSTVHAEMRPLVTHLISNIVTALIKGGTLCSALG